MAELKYQPVPHNHKEFLAKAGARKGFADAYKALELGITGSRITGSGLYM